MFLRANRRIKDGKEHRYWNIVENRRVCTGKTIQQQVLYLGEINDRQRVAWQRTSSVILPGGRLSSAAAYRTEGGHLSKKFARYLEHASGCALLPVSMLTAFCGSRGRSPSRPSAKAHRLSTTVTGNRLNRLEACFTTAHRLPITDSSYSLQSMAYSLLLADLHPRQPSTVVS